MSIETKKRYPFDEAQYPFMDGFYDVVDVMAGYDTGELVDTIAVMGAVGVYQCADGLCSGQCSHSIHEIKEFNDYSSSNDAYTYSDGARAALDSLTNVTIIPARRESRRV